MQIFMLPKLITFLPWGHRWGSIAPPEEPGDRAPGPRGALPCVPKAPEAPLHSLWAGGPNPATLPPRRTHPAASAATLTKWPPGKTYLLGQLYDFSLKVPAIQCLVSEPCTWVSSSVTGDYT